LFNYKYLISKLSKHKACPACRKEFVEQCPICQENIQKEDAIVTKCGHLFHYNCLKTWFCSSREINLKSCPSCRAKLVENITEEVYELNEKLKNSGIGGFNLEDLV